MHDRAESRVEPATAEETARHIRGSTVLFAGRLLGLLLQTATQILIVRLLTKSDYGAFAYALAFVATARAVVAFGHGQSLTRFLALYHEQRSYPKLAGTLVMEAITIVSAGGFLFVVVLGARGYLTGTIVDDPLAVDVLAVMVLLAPIEALDRVFEAAFSVFTRPRAIVFRKYVLVPLLRLALVGALFATRPSMTVLTVGYVAIGALGVALYTVMLARFFRAEGLLGYFRPGAFSMPVREVWGFTLPLLSTELVPISMNAVSVGLLGYFAGTVEVAEFRAVFQAARLNYLVYFTFTLLFVPLATRLFARGDLAGMRRAYWTTAAWLALLTFPVFAVTVPLAEPTTVLLFGEAYAGSAVYLALVSIGFYLSAVLGFNFVTLRTYGRVRYLVGVNVAVAGANAALSLALIPPLGALGVAVANLTALLLQNGLCQIGLRRIGLPAIDRAYASVFAWVAGAAGVVALVHFALSPPFAFTLVLVAVVSAALLVVNRRLLDLEGTYPQLAEIPLVRRLVG